MRSVRSNDRRSVDLKPPGAVITDVNFYHPGDSADRLAEVFSAVTGSGSPVWGWHMSCAGTPIRSAEFHLGNLGVRVNDAPAAPSGLGVVSCGDRFGVVDRLGALPGASVSGGGTSVCVNGRCVVSLPGDHLERRAEADTGLSPVIRTVVLQNPRPLNIVRVLSAITGEPVRWRPSGALWWPVFLGDGSDARCVRFRFGDMVVVVIEAPAEKPLVLLRVDAPDAVIDRLSKLPAAEPVGGSAVDVAGVRIRTLKRRPVDRLRRFPYACEAKVSRGGRPQPCRRVAVAVAEDVDDNWWPVCADHVQHRRVLPLGELLGALGL